MKLSIFSLIIIFSQACFLFVRADEVIISNPNSKTAKIELNKLNPIEYTVRQNGMAILQSIQFSTYEYETDASPVCLNAHDDNPDSLLYNKELNSGIKKCALKLIKNLANVTRADFGDTLGGVVNWFADTDNYKTGKQYYIRVSFDLKYRNPQKVWTIMLNEYAVGPLQVNDAQTSDAKHRRKRNFSRYSSSRRRSFLSFFF